MNSTLPATPVKAKMSELLAHYVSGETYSWAGRQTSVIKLERDDTYDLALGQTTRKHLVTLLVQTERGPTRVTFTYDAENDALVLDDANRNQLLTAEA